MNERSVFNSYLAGQLEALHNEILALHKAHTLCDRGVITPEEVDYQVYRVVGLLPDDMRPAGVPATPFRNAKARKTADDLL